MSGEQQKTGMTVAELIAALGRYPPDARVVVDGCEEGFDDPHVFGVWAVFGSGPLGCEGRHREVHPSWGDEGGAACVVVANSEASGEHAPWAAVATLDEVTP